MIAHYHMILKIEIITITVIILHDFLQLDYFSGMKYLLKITVNI